MAHQVNVLFEIQMCNLFMKLYIGKLKPKFKKNFHWFKFTWESKLKFPKFDILWSLLAEQMELFSFHLD